VEDHGWGHSGHAEVDNRNRVGEWLLDDEQCDTAPSGGLYGFMSPPEPKALDIRIGTIPFPA